MENLNDNKKEVFTVPDGYFEQLNRNIIKATAGNEVTAPRRKHFVLGKFARITGYAAAIAILSTFAIKKFIPADNITNETSGIIANENGYSSNEYIDNIYDSYAIDDYTFYCYLTDIDFE